MTFSGKKWNKLNDKLVNKMDFFQRFSALCNKTDLVLKSFKYANCKKKLGMFEHVVGYEIMYSCN